MPMVSKFNDDLIQPVQSWLWCQFIMKIFLWNCYCFPRGSDGKESACNAGDPGSSPGSGRSPWEGNGNPLWYSCLENPIDRRAWWITVHGVTKNGTALSEHTHTHQCTGVRYERLQGCNERLQMKDMHRVWCASVGGVVRAGPPFWHVVMFTSLAIFEPGH